MGNLFFVFRYLTSTLLYSLGEGRGVDALAHSGATSVGGRTVGVLGTGIDVCYPKENKKLFEKVLEKGAIISELPTGSHPAPENFPVRNRIIAGMPLGVLIVEGKQYSGSPITARLAMEFGREVFGIPRNITQEVSFAPNQLIRQGAKLVTDAEDVIEELPTPVRAALVQAESAGSGQRNLLAADGLSPIEKRIYDLLSTEESKPIDELVESTGLNSSEVLATLFDLELTGIIRQLPGSSSRRSCCKWESPLGKRPDAPEASYSASEVGRWLLAGNHRLR
jgi:DNA processing protein